MENKFPVWYDGKQINEVEFCKEFLSENPLQCVTGKLYSVDGAVSDNKIAGEIYDKLSGFVTSNIAKKSENILKALKYQCRCDGFTAKEDEIHLLNGVLKTDGRHFQKFCVKANPIRQKTGCKASEISDFLLIAILPQGETVCAPQA